MNKIYLLVPLVGVLVFGGFYWPYQRHHEARLAAEGRLANLAREEKSRRQLAAQAIVTRQANLVLEQRRQERAAQAQLEDARQRARAEAEQRRAAVLEREKKLRAQVDRLRTELAGRQAAVARAEGQKLELEREQRFLAVHVKDVVADRDMYVRVLEDLEAVESRAPATAPTNRSDTPLQK